MEIGISSIVVAILCGPCKSMMLMSMGGGVDVGASAGTNDRLLGSGEWSS